MGGRVYTGGQLLLQLRSPGLQMMLDFSSDLGEASTVAHASPR